MKTNSIFLLDVNVLLALVWPNHSHHNPANEWFLAHHSQGWATCSLVENGFVRISSNRKMTPEAVSPDEAIATLQKVRLLPGHQFWVDNFSMATVELGILKGHRQITDLHLLRLAESRGGKLVTFDQKISDLVRPNQRPEDMLLIL